MCVLSADYDSVPAYISLFRSHLSTDNTYSLSDPRDTSVVDSVLPNGYTVDPIRVCLYRIPYNTVTSCCYHQFVQYRSYQVNPEVYMISPSENPVVVI